jgi:hypothetical protein
MMFKWLLGNADNYGSRHAGGFHNHGSETALIFLLAGVSHRHGRSLVMKGSKQLLLAQVAVAVDAAALLFPLADIITRISYDILNTRLGNLRIDNLPV